MIMVSKTVIERPQKMLETNKNYTVQVNYDGQRYSVTPAWAYQVIQEQRKHFIEREIKALIETQKEMRLKLSYTQYIRQINRQKVNDALLSLTSRKPYQVPQKPVPSEIL